MTLYVQREAFGNDDGFELNDENFQIAVALQQHHTEALLNDQRYVKWYARYVKHLKGQQRSEKLYEMHKCTQADLAKFYPQQKRTISNLEKIIKGEGFFCLDWDKMDI